MQVHLRFMNMMNRDDELHWSHVPEVIQAVGCLVAMDVILCLYQIIQVRNCFVCLFLIHSILIMTSALRRRHAVPSPGLKLLRLMMVCFSDRQTPL